jgi:SAM-dependent methyltransferase
MFDKSAHLYDLVYEKGLGKDYAAEADLIVSLAPTARTLLDVACGTGRHLQDLSTRFECEGIDLDEGMLAIAKQRCPAVPLHVGDMTEFDLGRTFDVVICLFSSISYTRTEDRLRAAVASMASHVAPGGSLVVEPWLTPEMITPGHVGLLTATDDVVTVARMSQIEVDGQAGTIHMHYLVGTADGIERFDEHHEVCQFTWDQYRAAFEDAGLETTIDEIGGPMGRGLIVGRRAS